MDPQAPKSRLGETSFVWFFGLGDLATASALALAVLASLALLEWGPYPSGQLAGIATSVYGLMVVYDFVRYRWLAGRRG